MQHAMIHSFSSAAFLGLASGPVVDSSHPVSGGEGWAAMNLEMRSLVLKAILHQADMRDGE